MHEPSWNDIEELFAEALDRPPDERAEFLAETCESERLREEILSLLAAREEHGTFFQDLAEAEIGPRTEGTPSGSEEDGAGAFSDPLDLCGTSLEGYEVEEYLGGGSMGIVYRARDTELGRRVALKFLPPYLSTHSEARERFVREARAAARLDHPHIATVHEIGRTEGGRRFIAMAYYEGETLKEKLARRGPLPIEEAVRYAMQIADGLAVAHEAGIVHRDVKPANVIVTEEENVKLVDFGLARASGESSLTEPGRRLGTAAYMSPEQAKGAELDRRTDLWSLGVVLYEMLTGERPFRAEGEPAVLRALITEEPEPVSDQRPEVPSDLTAIVERCLRKSPDERYESAEALREELRQATPIRGVERRASRSGQATGWFTSLDLLRGPVTAMAGWRRWIGAGIVLVVLAGLLYTGTSSTGPATGGGSDPPRLGEESVAVLPFTYLAAEDSSDYFSQGVTEELIIRLSKVESLSVIGRSSVMRYEGSEKTVPQIGKELGVAHVVTGSLQRVGQQVRVRAQLLDAGTGEHEWGGSYTRRMENVLQLQSDLAREVAENLRANLLPRDQKQLATERVVDSTAYQLYLRARRLRFEETASSLMEAARLLDRSVAIDSTFAPAWALLSFCGWVAPELGGTLPAEVAGIGRDSLPRVAARRALAIDSTSAEAHIALANVYENLDRNPPPAGPHYQRAVELNPGLSEAHREYGLYFMRMGRFDLAERYLRQAARLDPAAAVVFRDLGWNDLWRGRYAEAERHLRKALALEPGLVLGRYSLAQAYAWQDRWKAVRRVARSDSTALTLAVLGRAYAEAGRTDSARIVLEHLKETGAPRWTRAAVRAWLGQTDRALDLISGTRGGIEGGFLKVDPLWTPLRDEPRFREILEQRGLDAETIRATIDRLAPEPPPLREGEGSEGLSLPDLASRSQPVGS